VGDISKAAAEADAKRQASLDEGVVLPKEEIEVMAKGGWSHFLRSVKGYVPYNHSKVNQDRALVTYGLMNNPDISLFAVMDGHGEEGHHVAQYVKEHLSSSFTSQANLLTSPEDSLIAGVHSIGSSILKSSINCAFSGSTLVFALKIRQTLYIGNVGDSRAVLCTKTKGILTVQPLSEDQKPDSPGEKQRILAAGGRVKPIDGPPGEDCGPFRVWLADLEVPGLAMSRSIGDEVSQSVGVICTPVIRRHDVASEDLFVILASDGVWEFISNEEACYIVWRHRSNLSDAADELIAESKKRWRAAEDVVDDITCVILTFCDLNLQEPADFHVEVKPEQKENTGVGS